MMRTFSRPVLNSFGQRGGFDPSFAVGVASGLAAGIATAVVLPMAAQNSGLWNAPGDTYLTAVSSLSSAISVGSLVAQVGRFRENPPQYLNYTFETSCFAATALVAAIGAAAANFIMHGWPLGS